MPFVIDKEFEKPLYSKICSYCRHFHANNPAGVNECDAFPDGIPDAIWMGENDHTGTYRGDHGIRFERR